jgi:hypothetical protein
MQPLSTLIQVYKNIFNGNKTNKHRKTSEASYTLVILSHVFGCLAFHMLFCGVTEKGGAQSFSTVGHIPDT